jgi:hypothetical protein
MLSSDIHDPKKRLGQAQRLATVAMNQQAAPKPASNRRRVPLELRQRTERSCDRCKSRKQKCSTTPGQDKCQHCQKYGYDCVVTKPRKQRIYGSLETHGAKVVLLESLVKGLLPEADLSNVDSMQEMARSLGIPVPATASSASQASQENIVQAGSDSDTDADEHLVHDLQGQGQYIGRASSYIFQMTLRGLVGLGHTGPGGRMYLFGPNPANSSAHSGSSYTGANIDEPLDMQSIASASPSNTALSPSTDSTDTDQSLIFSLVRAYFDCINVEFPVLHEAIFLEQLDAWCRDPTGIDQVWVCSLLCVLILGRRHSSAPVTDEQEERWWSRIQALLSKVMFTSSLTSIQGLMLTALHLHNTNSRDICWTLTGAAVRIGFAIGLHRDGIEITGTPLNREMRKRVWWTLYAFEQIQVSSHDRPSAIDGSAHLGRSPRETTLGMASHGIPDYLTWSNRSVILLGSACRALPDIAKDGYSGPLAPAAGLLRDLVRWRSALPQHLSMQSLDAMPPSFQRPIILLHVQHHYIVSLISRYALVSRFTTLSKDSAKAIPVTLKSVVDACIESGRLSCQMLLRLDSIKQFNAVTWHDVYYLYSSCLVLALSIICDTNEGKVDTAIDDRVLLRQCMDLATNHLRNPMVPGTMHRWLEVVGELNTLVAEFAESRRAIKHENVVVPAGNETSQVGIDQPCDIRLPMAQPLRSTIHGQRSQGGIHWPVVDHRDASLGVREDLGMSEVAAALPMSAILSSPDSGFDPMFSLGANATGSQLWYEMHWEGISDMLLGMEPRSASRNRF